MWFYYLTANKIRDVFRNFEPLASLRPHLCKSVNFSRFIKNDTTPHIVFVFSSRDQWSKKAKYITDIHAE